MAYSSIIKPTDYFNTKLYTGNGSAGHAITGVGHQPDWVWMKGRNQSFDQCLYDAVRGVTKLIRTNLGNAEVTQSGVTSFNSDGFTLGSSGETNSNNDTYVAWNWKANGQGSSNTDGTINSTYTSVNTTSGFSIVSYTGTNATATVGHGLGVAPKMIIWKELGNTNDWPVWHTNLSATQVLILNTNAAVASDSNVMGTLPTSSVFSIGQGARTNRSGGNYIAYCFADVQGYSKMGTYNGQGTTTGEFVYTGFKPSFVMTKIATTSSSDTGGWVMVDNKRYPNNLSNSPILFGNLSNAESDAYNAEFFSNGFSFNANSVTVNGAGNTYSYMAFAETPFVANSGQSIPTTAR